jgi:histidinol phosphatase-like PHP family hydrolase
MDGRLARRAVEAGVTLSIDSDCHNAARLATQMALGVGTARRGRVEARHVLNTRRVASVKAFLEAKPARLAADVQVGSREAP